MARFKKNARGYYQTGVTIGYDERGRIKRKWLYAKTISELEEKIAQIKGEIKSGTNF